MVNHLKRWHLNSNLWVTNLQTRLSEQNSTAKPTIVKQQRAENLTVKLPRVETSFCFVQNVILHWTFQETFWAAVQRENLSMKSLLILWTRRIRNTGWHCRPMHCTSLQKHICTRAPKQGSAIPTVLPTFFEFLTWPTMQEKCVAYFPNSLGTKMFEPRSSVHVRLSVMYCVERKRNSPLCASRPGTPWPSCPDSAFAASKILFSVAGLHFPLPDNWFWVERETGLWFVLCQTLQTQRSCLEHGTYEKRIYVSKCKSQTNWKREDCKKRSNRFGPKGQGTSLPPLPCTARGGWHVSGGWHISFHGGCQWGGGTFHGGGISPGRVWLWSLLGWWLAGGVASMGGGGVNQRSHDSWNTICSILRDFFKGSEVTRKPWRLVPYLFFSWHKWEGEKHLLSQQISLLLHCSLVVFFQL